MQIREFFPVLNTQIHGKPWVYLDNSATMQMPEPVSRRIEQFYREENSNIHRGIHSMSEKTTAAYEAVRVTVSRFLDQHSLRPLHCPENVIFTPGTTASINMTAQMLEPFLETADEILVTAMEHHSNLLPWMELAKRKGCSLRIVPVRKDGTLDIDAMENMLSDRTKIAAFAEISNVTGILNPVETMIQKIRENTRAFILVDGAQGVVHNKNRTHVLQPDFYCFSGHKLGAPTGTGVLYVREDVQKQVKPIWFGGGIVTSVSIGGASGVKTSYVTGPSLFEPGTPNYAGVIGLGAALDFWMEQEKQLSDAGKECSYECSILAYLEEELQQIEGIRILGAGKCHFGCLSFTAEDMHAYDICRLLDQYGIAVRSGHMCAQPYLEALGCEHAVRVSVAPYNTIEEIRYFVQKLQEILKITRYRREIADSTAMSMQELEQDILHELEQLHNPMEQYSFLIACAGECLPYPEDYRNEQYFIPECQVNTWVYTNIIDGDCVFFADSESLIVKGVLALLQEIFFGRSPEEIRSYSPQLLQSPMIRSHLNQGQLKGMEAIAASLCRHGQI